MKIAVLGAGAWGTALAIAFAKSHRISLWARREAQRALLRDGRCSEYLPGFELPAEVEVADTLADAMSDADVALLATPTAALRETLGALRDVPAAVLWACKGFEQATGLLPHQIVAEVCGGRVLTGALSGPSFALEVAQGLPTALTLAAGDAVFARDVARALHQPRLRVYFSDDVIGVEVGGAVKNVMAIATGISDGLGLGLNARAALITRGLAEMTRLGVVLGGRAATFMGLTGVGDLVLTATGDLSRNRRVGLALGRGEALPGILQQLGHVAEGVDTAAAVDEISSRLAVDMPISRAVAGVLFGGVAPRAAVEQLLARDPKQEQ